MIVIILKFKNLNRSIVFSICFIYLFNLSSIVYANHKVKDERIIGVGTLVSSGLAFLAKAEVVAVLCALGLRLGLDMNNTNKSAVEEFIEKNPDLINQENFGKSDTGLIAVSKNVIDKFTTFLKDMFKENPQDTISNEMISIFFDYRQPKYHAYDGFTIGPYSKDIQFGEFVNGTDIQRPEGYLTLKAGDIATFKVADFSGWTFNNVFGYTTREITRYQGYGSLVFPKNYDYGTYVPQNQLKDDLGNVYTGDKDFILNPSWDVNSNSGVLEGFPSLPWSEDKTFGSTGSIGVLNPDGTITGSPSIPDVENPDIPDVDTNEQTGILGWLTSFWENLWNFCMELVKKLFYPQKAIDAWTNLNSMIWDKFRFLGQLNEIKWSTNNNQRLRIPFTYNNRTYIIQLPDSFEENNVTYFRNIFKYFVYAITLFVCVRILRPRFTIGTR